MTADTYSNALGFLIMGTGNDNNQWGGNANTAVFQIFEDAIAGTLTSSVSGGTIDLSGSPPPAAASQARYAILIFNGALSSNQTVILPNLSKTWTVINNTTGGFSLLFQLPSGALTQVPHGTGGVTKMLVCDGAGTLRRLDKNEVGTIRFSGGLSARGGELPCDGTNYLRASYPDLFAAITVSTTGNTTSGSPIITNIPSTTGMRAGHAVSGTGIPSATAILTVDSATQITLNKNATSSNTGGAFVVAPWGPGDGSTTFTAPLLTDSGRFLRSSSASLAPGTYQADTVGPHNHSASASTSVSVSLTDPGHSHGVSDPGHIHFIGATNGGGVGGVGILGAAGGSNFQALSVAALTGISIVAAATGMSASASASTSVTVNNNTGTTETRPVNAVAFAAITF